jgi:hypothetical protein
MSKLVHIFVSQLHRPNIQIMRLSKICIDHIKGSKRIKALLALEMDRSVHTIEAWLATNNEDLTKAKALAVIQKETGWLNDQILEKEAIKE